MMRTRSAARICVTANCRGDQTRPAEPTRKQLTIRVLPELQAALDAGFFGKPYHARAIRRMVEGERLRSGRAHEAPARA